jgi:hypothetical protein
MLFKYFPKPNSSYYKSSKCKCSPKTPYPFPNALYSTIYSKRSSIKNHSIWSLVPGKISKRLQLERQKKYLASTLQKQKLSRKNQRRSLIPSPWKVFKDIINHPNLNPFSPLFQEEEEEEDDDDEETIAPLTTRTKMPNKSSKENFLKVMNYNDEELSELENTNAKQHPWFTAAEKAKHHEPSQTNCTIEKEHTTEYDYNAVISNKYAPRNLTWTTERKQADSSLFKENEDNYFALLVRVGQNKDDNLDFHEGRIMISLLKSFQQVMPYIKIKPFNDEQGTLKDIEKEDDIQCNESFLNNYLEKPMITNNNQFVTRIYFVAKKPFFWYKKNIQFQRWLSSEKIKLEENNIAEMHCPKVGFLVRCHPRISMVKVYEERIKAMLGRQNIPQFYCTIENVSVRQATTKVVMIRSAEADLSKLLNKIMDTTTDNLHTFIPWREWVAMISSKQLDLIQKENKLMTKVKSIILSGFKDNDDVKLNYSNAGDDSIDMLDDNEKVPTIDEFGEMTFSEFLLSKYKDGQGNKIFDYCYPVSLGIRELLVTHNHASEAITLCKTVKVDSLHYMTFEAANKIFTDTITLHVKKLDHVQWKPFMTANNYNEVDSSVNENNYPASYKRYRIDNASIDQKVKQLSYKDIAIKHNKRQESTYTTQNNLSNCPENNQNKTKIDLLESRLEAMEKKQNAQEDKLDKTSKAIFTEIRKTNDKSNQNNNELREIKAQISTMATQGWILETFGELLSVTKHIKSQFPVKEQHGNKSNNNMILDKETNKRHNAEFTCDDYDSDKENNGLGGNQTKCKYSKSDYFGNCSP